MRPLARLIQHEIAEKGPIPFNRFMELALYCPEYGFYEKEADNVGRAGDFQTSVSVGPLFGELLAFQFSRWLEGMRSAERGLRMVEVGAHDGRLAADVLDWLRRQRPEIMGRTEYCIIEPSARRCDWQRKTLAEFQPAVRWLDRLPDPQSMGRDPAFTIVFSNELLDAMPLRRFGWDAALRSWFEWGVGVEVERFVWARLPGVPSDAAGGEGVAGLPFDPGLLAVLPDAFTVELSPAAERWWGEAARALTHGRLLTVDYGFDAAGALIPERPNGTLRAYRNHQHCPDVLADPGEQDITAHVNFASIEQAGLAAGLRTEMFETQGRFLTKLASAAWEPGSGFGDWDSKRTRQLQTLTHPEHFGRSFRVLVQSRGCSS